MLIGDDECLDKLLPEIVEIALRQSNLVYLNLFSYISNNIFVYCNGSIYNLEHDFFFKLPLFNRDFLTREGERWEDG